MDKARGEWRDGWRDGAVLSAQVSLEMFERINEMAHQAMMTRSAVVRQLLDKALRQEQGDSNGGL